MESCHGMSELQLFPVSYVSHSIAVVRRCRYDTLFTWVMKHETQNMNYKRARTSTMHSKFIKTARYYVNTSNRAHLRSGAGARANFHVSHLDTKHHTQRCIYYSTADVAARLAPTPLLIHPPSHNASTKKKTSKRPTRNKNNCKYIF